MRRSLLRFSPTLAAIALAIAALLASRHTPRAVAAQNSAETARMRAHLERVESELLSAHVSSLSVEQRAARAYNIALLREYREAGEFPHNDVAPGHRAAVLVDEHGARSALAFLLERAGRHRLVERVRTTTNTANPYQLADEPLLLSWLAESGFTLAEAARLQPASAMARAHGSRQPGAAVP